MDGFRSVRDVLRVPAVPVREVKMNVYNLIAKVSADLCQQGIAKDRRNTQQGYGFRGIDDVYNALAPIISKHGLVILPRVISREVSERMGKSGSSLFYVVVEVEFDFVSSHDGTKHTVKTFGEAMDSGDKATNKAMSAAYKYAAFQTFCIPTEGDNDADATTHQVGSGDAKAAARAPAKAGPELLTKEEIANITALAQEVGADIKPILTFYKVGSLAFIPRARYEQIVRSLEKKRTEAPAPADAEAQPQ